MDVEEEWKCKGVRDCGWAFRLVLGVCGMWRERERELWWGMNIVTLESMSSHSCLDQVAEHGGNCISDDVFKTFAVFRE